MTDLIKRLEEAEAGSRKLDVLIAVEIDLTDARNDLSARRSLAIYGLETFASRASAYNNAWQTFLPAYTTSLDAALALAERVISQRGPIELSICGSAQAVIHHNDPCGNPLAMVYGNTPALALCIAVLKATDTGREA
jgi:hypothetical protein